MSTIFGICRSERPGHQSEDGQRMQSAMDYWKPDHIGVSEADGVLLGQLLLRNTPESVYEKGPLQLAGITIAADVRIDNRGELMTKAGLDAEACVQMPDAALILHLYRSLGVDGLKCLQGDFAFAIYDSNEKVLTCFRDPMGIRPFHYSLIGMDFLFASEPAGILAHPEANDALDEDFITRLMAGLPPPPEATFRKHIRHLPPGHILQWTYEGLKVFPLRSVEIPPLLKLARPEEYQELFREELMRAVSCRMRALTPIGIELSGGLDSSAVTVFAASLIPQKKELYTFTNVSADNRDAGLHHEDEWKYASAVVSHSGIEHAIRISEGGWSYPFEPMDLHIQQHAGVDLVSPFWLEPAMRQMHALGIQTCLSGFMGDEVATHKGQHHFYDYLHDGQPLEFLKSCIERKKFMLPISLLARQLIPDALLKALRRPRTDVGGYLLGRLPSPSSKESQSDDQHIYSHRRFLQKLAGGLYSLRRMQNESMAGIRHRIEPRYPFADIRLIEFFLSLPAGMSGHPHMDRYMYRSSLAGIVPELVRQRSDKQIPVGVFPAVEMRRNASAFLQESARIRNGSSHPMLQRLDFALVEKSLDPREPGNRWKGEFFPMVPFHILALLRFFDSEGLALQGRLTH